MVVDYDTNCALRYMSILSHPLESHVSKSIQVNTTEGRIGETGVVLFTPSRGIEHSTETGRAVAISSPPKSP